MTYAAKTKSQLARQITGNRQRMLAELSAVVRVCGELNLLNGGEIAVYISTENSALARLIFKLFKTLFNRQTDVVVKRNRSLRRHNIYQLGLSNALEILIALGLIRRADGLYIVDEVPEFIYHNDENRRAYIRGIFLGSGSINDPEKSYHLEFVTHSARFADSFTELLQQYDLKAKQIERKGNYVIYLKDADSIVKVLSIIGAHTTLLEFENTRIVKEMRNKANRLVNCDTANLNKTIQAAERHLMAIDLIDTRRGLTALPQALRDVAIARRDYPELSLTELGKLLKPPLGKSGINHRMKKIEEIAQSIKENDHAED